MSDDVQGPTETTDEWSDRVSAEFADRWRRDRAETPILPALSDDRVEEFAAAFFDALMYGEKKWADVRNNNPAETTQFLAATRHALESLAAGDRPPADPEERDV